MHGTDKVLKSCILWTFHCGLGQLWIFKTADHVVQLQQFVTGDAQTSSLDWSRAISHSL